MRERSILINSISKTYSVTGWRLVYVIAPESVIGGVRKVHDFLTVGAAAPLRQAALAALASPDEHYRGLAEDYQRRCSLFLDGLDQAGLLHTLPQGAYYMLAASRRSTGAGTTWPPASGWRGRWVWRR